MMLSNYLTIKDLAVACNALCEEGKGDSHVVVRDSGDAVCSCAKDGVVYDFIHDKGCLIFDIWETDKE